MARPRTSNKAVLFANIGWSEEYLGEPVKGNHGYLSSRQARKQGSAEDWLFWKDESGHYWGGIGRGKVPTTKLDVVFLTNYKPRKVHHVVAIYFDAKWKRGEDNWVNVASTRVRTFPFGRRPSLTWGKGQGIRRWACGGKRNHPDLYRAYEELTRRLGARRVPPAATPLNREALAQARIQEKERLREEMERAARDQRIRSLVLEDWGAKCAACGLALSVDDLHECEVAHIWDVKYNGPDTGNVLPLCRTHHWAFDRNLWAIHPGTKKAVVRKAYRKHPALTRVHNHRLRPEKAEALSHLSQKFLKKRWERFVTGH